MRTMIALLIGAAALAAPVTSASAKIEEIGRGQDEQFKASCPDQPCLAVSRTTGFQVKAGDTRRPYVAPRNGKVVAWTITLGKPGEKQQAFFEQMLGGPASARIVVLKPGKKLRWRVSGVGDLQKLTPWFGQTVQFALERSLTVKKGYTIGLSVPTWAPALGVGLDRSYAWRASRNQDACDDTQAQTAQVERKQLAQYRCLYRTARLTYSATVVSTP